MAAEYRANDIIHGSSDAYRVVRVLGSGGMGDVYEVEDRNLGKRFVLKIIRTKHAERKDLIKRFELEARALGRLNHPNIVEILRLDHVRKTHVPFYLMERLDGESLRAVLARKGRLKPQVAIGIAVDILDALEHAHEKNVIHRDVKPENIILHRERPGFTVAKLIDFGIMKVLQAESDQARLTAEGTFIGTYSYAAPEQIFGSWNVSPRTDLWSLGVMFFEMVTGINPFTVGRKSEHEIVASVRAPDPAPLLSTFEDVPEALDAIIAAALCKDRNGRPPDAFSFAAELRRIQREHYRKDRAPDTPQTQSTASTVEDIATPATPTIAGPITLGQLATATTPDVAPAFLAAHFAGSSVKVAAEPSADTRAPSPKKYAGTAAFADTVLSSDAIPVSLPPSTEKPASSIDREAPTRVPSPEEMPLGCGDSERAIEYAQSTLHPPVEAAGGDGEGATTEERQPAAPVPPIALDAAVPSHHGFAAGDATSRLRLGVAIGQWQWLRKVRHGQLSNREILGAGASLLAVAIVVLLWHRPLLTASNTPAAAAPPAPAPIVSSAPPVSAAEIAPSPSSPAAATPPARQEPEPPRKASLAAPIPSPKASAWDPASAKKRKLPGSGL